jgi:hypothetical protein
MNSKIGSFHGAEHNWKDSEDYRQKQQAIAREVDEKYNRLIEGVTDQAERRKIIEAHSIELKRRLLELGSENLY